MKSVFATLLQELNNGKSCELVTILSVSGTAPREPGCSMLVGSGGRPLAGTVGGGRVEWQAVNRAAELLNAKESGEEVFAHGMKTETDGSSCGAKVMLRFSFCEAANAALVQALTEALSSGGGTLRLSPGGEASFRPGERVSEVLKEDILSLYLPPQDRVLLFGAGHVAQALVPLLRPLGFSVTVFDERSGLADPAHFPEARNVLNGSFSEDLPARTGAMPEDYIVIMSAAHSSDELILSHFMDRTYRYVGMLGSRKKAAAIRERLMKKGVPEARLNKVHIPIGLSIGARTPEEVALSVAAELVKTRAETQVPID